MNRSSCRYHLNSTQLLPAHPVGSITFSSPKSAAFHPLDWCSFPAQILLLITLSCSPFDDFQHDKTSALSNGNQSLAPFKWETKAYKPKANHLFNVIWLVVSTPLKNISQLVLLLTIYGEIKHIPNHQPVIFRKVTIQRPRHAAQLRHLPTTLQFK